MKIFLAVLLCLLVAAAGWSEDVAKPTEESGSASSDSQPAADLTKEADITVSVTATRAPQVTDQIPASITTITSEQLEHKTITEALSMYAGIDLRSFNGSSVSSQPSARGFTEGGQGRVLILFDGIKLNNPDMSGIDWLAIPGAGSGGIEKIEVVKGGASSLYGDYAVASVINIIPVKPKEGVSLNVAAEGGSNSYLEKKIIASAGSDVLSISVSAIDSKTDGYRDRTGTENTNFSANISTSFAEKGSASLFLSSGKQMYELPGGLLENEFKDDPKQLTSEYDTGNDKTEIGSLFVQGQSKWEFTENHSLSLTAGYNSKDTSTDVTFYDREYKYTWRTFTDTIIDSVTAGLSFTGEFPLLFRGVTITTGADFIRDDLNIKRYDDANRENKNYSGEITKTNYAFFSRGELPVTEKLFFSLSGRYDYALYSGDLDTVNDDKNYSVFSYGTGLNFMFTDNGKVYARYDRVFRFPFLEELISYYGYSSDGFTKDLNPECGHSFDLGSEYRFGKLAVLGVNLFLLLMDDEISWNNATRQNENIDKTMRYGVESFASFFPVKYFSLTGTYNFTIAEFRDGDNKGNQIPLVPVHRFAIIPEFSLFNMFKLYSEISYSASFYEGGDESNALDKIDGYFLCNIGASVKIPVSKSFITVYGKVKNITDKKYAQLVYYNLYYPGSGREVLLGASYSY
ncbi:MAG: TonB-dependent receptor [Spirochaetaceae bacterium]|nr:TonB-dependent receptor [Spirochaetaceae bacterium]